MIREIFICRSDQTGLYCLVFSFEDEDGTMHHQRGRVLYPSKQAATEALNYAIMHTIEPKGEA